MSDMTATNSRWATGQIVKASLLYHPTDPMDQNVRQETGALDWALSYASTYFERGEWARRKIRLIEVVVGGEVIACYQPKP